MILPLAHSAWADVVQVRDAKRGKYAAQLVFPWSSRYCSPQNIVTDFLAIGIWLDSSVSSPLPRIEENKIASHSILTGLGIFFQINWLRLDLTRSCLN